MKSTLGPGMKAKHPPSPQKKEDKRRREIEDKAQNADENSKNKLRWEFGSGLNLCQTRDHVGEVVQQMGKTEGGQLGEKTEGKEDRGV